MPRPLGHLVHTLLIRLLRLGDVRYRCVQELEEIKILWVVLTLVFVRLERFLHGLDEELGLVRREDEIDVKVRWEWLSGLGGYMVRHR